MSTDTITAAATGTDISTRKLSKLQKQILALALENRVREGRAFESHHGADVFYSQILAEVYGFQTTWPLRRTHGEHAGQRICGQHLFDPATIGEGRYNAAQAAISRAMARLESRGLVRRLCGHISHWAGCDLTPAGHELAKRLAQIRIQV
jgi:hypothetical protein